VSKNFELLRQAGVSLGVGDAIAAAPAGGSISPIRPVRLEAEKQPSWVQALGVLGKHWRLSAVFAALVMLTATVVTFSMKATYEPIARVQVDPPGEAFSLDGGAPGNSDAEYMETQSQNLKGDKLAIAVIRKLHLDQNPELVPDPQARAQVQAVTDPQGETVQLSRAENTALGAFHARLNVKRDTASRLISISFASYDPQLAALITNTTVDTFIEQNYEEQHDTIMKSTEWLSRQLDDIRGRMESSNRVLAEFQKTIGVVD